MGGGSNLTPYIIHQEVYLSPLSLWKTNIYIYICIHSLYIYMYLSLSLSLSLSLPLYIHIYIYESGPNLAPYFFDIFL